MSRKRENYENGWWRKLQRFVDGERVEKHEYEDIFENHTSFLKNEADQKTTSVEQTPVKPHRMSRKELYKRYEKWPQTRGFQWFQIGRASCRERV